MREKTHSQQSSACLLNKCRCHRILHSEQSRNSELAIPITRHSGLSQEVRDSLLQFRSEVDSKKSRAKVIKYELDFEESSKMKIWM